MRSWFIGCSGFSYKHWKQRFYPQDVPVRKWFEFYCEHFNTVELNVTFYRFPKLETLQGWYKRSPDDFKFTVKAPKLVTHYKKFLNADREIREFYDVVANGLETKLGTILFQLPPSFAYSDENLERLIESLDPSFQNVIEFRHSTWWNTIVLKVLKSHNITFCGISYPGLPDDVIKTSPVMYYRFHGVPQLYKSPYTELQLQKVAADIKKYRNTQEVYIYFNNDIDVAAIDNARQFQELVGTKQLI